MIGETRWQAREKCENFRAKVEQYRRHSASKKNIRPIGMLAKGQGGRCGCDCTAIFCVAEWDGRKTLRATRFVTDRPCQGFLVASAFFSFSFFWRFRSAFFFSSRHRWKSAFDRSYPLPTGSTNFGWKRIERKIVAVIARPFRESWNAATKEQKTFFRRASRN